MDVLSSSRDEGPSDAVERKLDRGREADAPAAPHVAGSALTLDVAPQLDRRSSRAWFERRREIAALAVALAAHGLLLLYMVQTNSSILVGDGAENLVSIAVSIVILDAPTGIDAQETAAADASIKPIEDKIETVVPEKRRPPETERPPEPRIAEVQLPPEPVRPPDDTQRPLVAMTVPPPEVTAPPAQASVAMPPPLAAPASAGVIREYARHVAATLAKSKPKSTGHIGMIRLRFTIDELGHAGAVTIVARHGHEDLDDIAIDALSRSRFPRPPAGLVLAQRTFEVPYSFR